MAGGERGEGRGGGGAQPKRWAVGTNHGLRLGTPPYGHLVITATIFWPPNETAIHFLVKKKRSLIRSPFNTAK